MILYLMSCFLFSFITVGIIFYSKIRNLEKQSEENNRYFYKTFSHLLDSSEKLLKLVRDYKSENENNTNKIKDIIHDMDDLYEWNKKLTESLQKNIVVHHNFAEQVNETFKEIFCDLSEEDCSNCFYCDECLKGKDYHNEENTFKDSSIKMLPENPTDSKYKMDVDFNNEESVNRLKKALNGTGVPFEVIEDCFKRIKNSGLASRCQIVWDVKPLPGNYITINHHPYKESENKLVDPNSKYIKSLEKLFKKDN